MNKRSYPALYRSADESAARAQRAFFTAVGLQAIFLVAAAICSAVDSPAGSMALLQVMFLLIVLSAAVYAFAARPDQHWYRARALAESVKTATWRFVSAAEPFDGEFTVARSHFVALLNELLDQNRSLAKRLHPQADGAQVTSQMQLMREHPFAVHLETYVSQRITNQLRWYSTKASLNRKYAGAMFAGLFGSTTACIVFALIHVAAPMKRVPIDVFISVSSGLLVWAQARRFSELAAAYSLTAHEISLIREKATSIASASEMSRFVGDAENAFSREHTQWAARKDE